MHPDYRPAPVYPELGRGFFDEVKPASFPEQRLRFRNQRWAERLGLGELSDEAWARHFWAFEPLPDNMTAPLAMRYHGHQFRNYNADLGDGRGFLFAQLREGGPDGRLLDLGTKGSGTTPYSRGGDGRLTLKGGVRELLATEMLEALGVYTSKTFSLFETGESLLRGDEPSPTRSAVLVRLGHSHLRIGSFERHATENRPDLLADLIEHAVRHYEPDLWTEGRSARSLALPLFRRVVERSAGLVGQWMVAGFVHGVLNTDNINITGESFDYGPWRFLPHFDPGFTAAYFDHTGLYAFGRVPEAMLWNLARLGDALGSLVGEGAPFEAQLEDFQDLVRESLRVAFLRRLGLVSRGPRRDLALLDATYRYLFFSRVPYDRFYFDWRGGLAAESRAMRSPEAARYAGDRWSEVEEVMTGYEPSEGARATWQDDYWQGEGPETMLIDEVEQIWARIAEDDDWSPLEAKIARVRRLGGLLGNGPDRQRGRQPGPRVLPQ